MKEDFGKDLYLYGLLKEAVLQTFYALHAVRL